MGDKPAERCHMAGIAKTSDRPRRGQIRLGKQRRQRRRCLEGALLRKICQRQILRARDGAFAGHETRAAQTGKLQLRAKIEQHAAILPGAQHVFRAGDQSGPEICFEFCKGGAGCALLQRGAERPIGRHTAVEDRYRVMAEHLEGPEHTRGAGHLDGA